MWIKVEFKSFLWKITDFGFASIPEIKACFAQANFVLLDVHLTLALLGEIISEESLLFSFYNIFIKGQLISKWPFGAFKSPKKPTNFFKEFLP